MKLTAKMVKNIDRRDGLRTTLNNTDVELLDSKCKRLCGDHRSRIIFVFIKFESEVKKGRVISTVENLPKISY